MARRRSSGAARRWRSPAGCCASSGAAFPTPRLDALGPANTRVLARRRRSGASVSPPSARRRSSTACRSTSTRWPAGRRQPLPESDGRFGFGVPSRRRRTTRQHGRRGGGRRVSRRASSTSTGARTSSPDAAAGRPSSRASPPGGTDGVDAVYSQVLQVGGELETTRADWRFLSEGFIRRGDVDVLGRRRTTAAWRPPPNTSGSAPSTGAYNLIPRVEFIADTQRHRRGHPVRVVGPRRHARRHGAAAARAGRCRLLARLGRSAATASWPRSRRRSPRHRR